MIPNESTRVVYVVNDVTRLNYPIGFFFPDNPSVGLSVFINDEKLTEQEFTIDRVNQEINLINRAELDDEIKIERETIISQDIDYQIGDNISDQQFVGALDLITMVAQELRDREVSVAPAPVPEPDPEPIVQHTIYYGVYENANHVQDQQVLGNTISNINFPGGSAKQVTTLNYGAVINYNTAGNQRFSYPYVLVPDAIVDNLWISDDNSSRDRAWIKGEDVVLNEVTYQLYYRRIPLGVNVVEDFIFKNYL